MKYLLAVGFLASLTAFASAKEAVQPGSGVVVHEWGVFRVSDDVEFANAALRAEWDNLPGFVYGYIKGRTVPQHWGAVEIRFRPIIFFHSRGPAQLHARVDFPGGMPGVWFPATVNPAVEGFVKQPHIGGSLEWDLGIKKCPDGWQPKQAAAPEVDSKHWISRLRQVKADELFAKFSPNLHDVEREHFLFYDGLFPQGKWLKATVEKDRVSLKSQVKHSVFDVTIVDRRGERLRVGRIAKMEANEIVKEVKFTELDASRFSPEAAEALVSQLAKVGLFDDEAKSMVELWRKELFETPGVSLFYRVPQEEYDVRMPLTITPRPVSVVRVGLIYHNHLEPEFGENVFNLLRHLDAPRYIDRAVAMKKLQAIGPAALVQMKRLRDRPELSVQVREQIDIFIKKWDSKKAFDTE